MKAVILAGGLGSRLSEETETKPKPMVEIGGRPILWHIMKTYSHYGINDFIVCLGYKGHKIKEFFYHYNMHLADITIEAGKAMAVHRTQAEPWKVTLIETGDNTMTGGRIKRIADYVKDEDAFCLTYGDGVCDVDIGALIRFHNEQKRLATVTAVHPLSRFGALVINDGKVDQFKEKPALSESVINGGYFVLSPKILNYIEGDTIVWEQAPLERLVAEGQLSGFVHQGFWQCMDTIRDKKYLEELWSSGRAPWRVWPETA